MWRSWRCCSTSVHVSPRAVRAALTRRWRPLRVRQRIGWRRRSWSNAARIPAALHVVNVFGAFGLLMLMLVLVSVDRGWFVTGEGEVEGVEGVTAAAEATV